MRFLILDHPQFTHGTYFLWHGLKEIERDTQGAIQVECYPYIPTNYNTRSFNPLDLKWCRDMLAQIEAGNLPQGIPPFNPGEDLINTGQPRIDRYDLGQNWTPTEHEMKVTEEELADNLRQGYYDFVILGNTHRVPTIILARLRRMVGSKMPPLIYYDAGERDELNEHWVHVFHPRLTFKQILTPEVEAKGLSHKIPNYEFKMEPLPLSSIIVDYPRMRIGGHNLRYLQKLDHHDEKFLDIFYQLGATWDSRVVLKDLLDSITAEHKLSYMNELTYQNFHLVLAKTRMAVSMRGSGRDTLRYWEIPLYKTALLADGTMGCIHPYPFEDLKTAIFWTSFEELGQKVRKYLPRSGDQQTELINISAAGQKHLKRYHSTAARAIFFLDRLEANLKVQCGSLEAVKAMKDARGWEDRPWQGPVVGLKE